MILIGFIKKFNIFKCKTIYGIIIILLVWYIMHLLIEVSIIPNPIRVIKASYLLLINGTLVVHILISLYRIVIAILISIMIGVPIGLITGLYNKVDTLISPISYIMYPIPKIAFLPVFMVILGLGDLSKIGIITTIIFFQTLITTRDGVKEIPKDLFYSSKTLGLNKTQIFIHLIFPAVLPKILSSLRISLGISLSVLFYSENFATTYGIGYFIMNSWIMADYVQMFAGIMSLSMLGIMLFKLIDLIEKKYCKWLHFNGTSN